MAKAFSTYQQRVAATLPSSLPADFKPNSQCPDSKELPKMFYYGEDDYNI